MKQLYIGGMIPKHTQAVSQCGIQQQADSRMDESIFNVAPNAKNFQSSFIKYGIHNDQRPISS